MILRSLWIVATPYKHHRYISRSSKSFFFGNISMMLVCVSFAEYSLFHRALPKSKSLGISPSQNDWVKMTGFLVQGGEDPSDAFTCRSFFAKKALIIRLFCGKWPIKIRHPMGLRHPVLGWFWLFSTSLWRMTSSCVKMQYRARGMTHSYVMYVIHIWHDSFMCCITHSCVTWLTYTWHDFLWDMTHSYVTWLIHLWYDSFMCGMTDSCVTWLIHVWYDFIWDMTHSYVTWLIHMWHDSFICGMTHSCVIWLIHMRHDTFMCDMTHSYMTWLIHMWHDSFIRDTFICDMTLQDSWLIHVWHDSFSYGAWLIHVWHNSCIRDKTHPCVTWLAHVAYEWAMSHVTHINEWWVPNLIPTDPRVLHFVWMSHVAHVWVTIQVTHMNGHTPYPYLPRVLHSYEWVMSH